MYDITIDIKSKMKQILKNKKNVVVSVSGGSDSDILIDLFTKYSYNYNNVKYIFFNTGVEFNATLEHLDYLEKKYKIKIKRLKPKINVPRSIIKYGTPYKSKTYSEFLSRLQKHNFNFKVDGNKTFEVLIKKYPNCKSALSWWCRKNKNINISKKEKEKFITNPPKYKISAVCCVKSKKDLSKEYIKKNEKVDLMVLGIRIAEGGARSISYKKCWYNKKITKNKSIEFYLPILKMNDNQKEEYNKTNNIQNSKCYSIYNLKRTGCVGCPFSRNREHEIKVLKLFEPKKFQAIEKIYKDIYH